MNPVRDAVIHDDRVGEVYLSAEEIAARVAELGTEIAEDYAGQIGRASCRERV